MNMTAANGTQWTILNLYTTPSDSCYRALQAAIDSSNPQQHDLQIATGHRAPIVIDRDNHIIDFQRW